MDIKLPVGQRSCSAGSNASPVGDGWELEDQPAACESSAGVAGEWGRSSDSGWVRDSFTRRAEQSESNDLQKKVEANEGKRRGWGNSRVLQVDMQETTWRGKKKCRSAGGLWTSDWGRDQDDGYYYVRHLRRGVSAALRR